MVLYRAQGSSGKGNRLASTLYELDQEVQAEIDKASKKPNDSSGRKVVARSGKRSRCRRENVKIRKARSAVERR